MFVASEWKNGILELWNIGNKGENKPLFHYSIIPILQLGRSPLSSNGIVNSKL
jgi:hypothetical protein